MFAEHFATHRIAWSRAFIVGVLLLVVFSAPPADQSGWVIELSEMLGYFLLAGAALWRIWCALFIAGSKNGERYREYCARVPRWIPDWSLYQEPAAIMVSPRHVRGAIFDAMWFLWAFALWEFIEELHKLQLLPTLF